MRVSFGGVKKEHSQIREMREKWDFGGEVEMEYQGMRIGEKGHSQIKEMRGKQDFGREVEWNIREGELGKKDIPKSGKCRKNGIWVGFGNGMSGNEHFFFKVMLRKDIPKSGKCREMGFWRGGGMEYQGMSTGGKRTFPN